MQRLSKLNKNQNPQVFARVKPKKKVINGKMIIGKNIQANTDLKNTGMAILI